MCKIPLFLALLLLLAGSLSAQEQISQTSTADDSPKMAVSIGHEWNMNSRDNFAGGTVLTFDYNLPQTIRQLALPPFAAGLTVTISNNFNGFTVLETAALFRWYFLNKGGDGWNWLTKDYGGFFAQADIGFTITVEDSETTPYFLGGLRAGFRLPLGKMFFIEPFGRLGYPFAFGTGATAGIKF
ncbi:MAG: hypothetical protein FWD36_10105 [Treponema sp.]|nr:hypothetical protein [Treponema sp.]